MKPRNIFKFLWIALVIHLLPACSSEEISLEKPEINSIARVSDGKVIVDMSILAPDMAQIQTRTLTGEPDLNNLVLYLVEFEDYGNTLRNTLNTTYKPTITGIENGKVKFTVILNQTSQSRILHLIALPKDDLKIEYGVEASVFSSLTTDNATPAYWRRLTFPYGYAKEVSPKVFEPTDEIGQLNNVALIRNFACVSVDNKAEGFTLTGFAIVNNPQSGSIAPWNSSDYSFPTLLGSGQTMLPYSDIVTGYTGYVPETLKLSNPESGPTVPDDVSPKYLYERPFNSIRHTYVMIKGKFNNDATNTEYYYKLDIGKQDDNKIFRYMHVIRNLRYNIILKSIDPNAKGYTSALAAAQGVVYNNFSFDIELSNMLNLSDGKDVVFVNFTTAVLTDPNPQQLVFKYRYRSVTSTSASGPTYNNDNVTFIGLEKGNVIEKVTYSTVNDEDGWRSVTLDCNGAQQVTQTQSFTIVNPNGLGRTINLILHRKWDLNNVYEIPGTLENWTQQTLENAGINPDSNSGSGLVPDGIGQPLTIFFDIPDNLQEAMFPLVFTLEANRQNIENNPIGSLVVTSGTSTFNNIQGRRIQYLKTVTWTQYNDPLVATDQDDNATAIKNPDGTVTHRVRCRFRTTTELKDLPFEESQTTVRITNPNFNICDIPFNRKEGEKTTP